MFEPDNDRRDYGKLLTPPDGYGVDFAVGTTYSLDLDALIGACMSLGLGEETDSEILDNPVYILDTLLRTGDKIALFCEGGQIKLPSDVRKFHALLERMVFEVAIPKRNNAAAYPSFHPKFWLIRYVKENGSAIYRVIVLSRNLTFDRSWDVVFSMDGKKTDEYTNKNKPVKDFLDFLLNQKTLAKEKKRGIKSLIDDLDFVRFDLGTKPFYDFEFLLVGINNAPTDIRTVLGLTSKRYDELFVMSPFLSNGEIKELNAVVSDERNAEAILITRRESLAKLKTEDCDKFKLFCMRDEVVNGESIQSDGEVSAEKFQAQDIHAKVYLSRKFSYQSVVELFLGSMNASHNALCGNVEFLIHLRTMNRYLNLAKIKEDLFGKDEGKNPFREVNLSEAANDETAERNRLDSVVKIISRAKKSATVVPNGDLYNVALTIKNFNAPAVNDCEVYLTPLLAERYTSKLDERITFENLSISQLTSFYRVLVRKGEEKIERIIIVPTDGIPETRDGAILSGIVSDQQKFFQYLTFLLGEDAALGAFESVWRGQAGNGSYRERTAALYEKMLEVAAREPSRFKEIDFIMKTISDDSIIPAEFTDMYDKFKKVVKANG